MSNDSARGIAESLTIDEAGEDNSKARSNGGVWWKGSDVGITHLDDVVEVADEREHGRHYRRRSLIARRAVERR